MKDSIRTEFPIRLKNIKGHLWTINRHKWEVMKLLFRIGLPRQALLHDLSKYSWTELSAGFRYFQGDHSANDGQKRAEGYSAAWLHHKGRNRHHWHYWLDFDRDGVYPIDMPYRYIAEMFCDRVAACKVYQKGNFRDASAWDYYQKGKPLIIMTDSSIGQLEELLLMMKDQGEEKTLEYLRQKIRQMKNEDLLDYSEGAQKGRGFIPGRKKHERY